MLETVNSNQWDVGLSEFSFINYDLKPDAQSYAVFDPAYPYIYVPQSWWRTKYSYFNKKIRTSFQYVNSN